MNERTAQRILDRGPRTTLDPTIGQAVLDALDITFEQYDEHLRTLTSQATAPDSGSIGSAGGDREAGRTAPSGGTEPLPVWGLVDPDDADPLGERFYDGMLDLMTEPTSLTPVARLGPRLARLRAFVARELLDPDTAGCRPPLGRREREFGILAGALDAWATSRERPAGGGWGDRPVPMMGSDPFEVLARQVVVFPTATWRRWRGLVAAPPEARHALTRALLAAWRCVAGGEARLEDIALHFALQARPTSAPPLCCPSSETEEIRDDAAIPSDARRAASNMNWWPWFDAPMVEGFNAGVLWLAWPLVKRSAHLGRVPGALVLGEAPGVEQVPGLPTLADVVTLLPAPAILSELVHGEVSDGHVG